jgi:hypothetical protein
LEEDCFCCYRPPAGGYFFLGGLNPRPTELYPRPPVWVICQGSLRESIQFLKLRTRFSRNSPGKGLLPGLCIHQLLPQRSQFCGLPCCSPLFTHLLHRPPAHLLSDPCPGLWFFMVHITTRPVSFSVCLLFPLFPQCTQNISSSRAECPGPCCVHSSRLTR